MKIIRTDGYKRSSKSWRSMKGRCLNPSHKSYLDYGKRGIKICKRWMVFENFIADMGERPLGMSLDRINNDGDYKPSNCQWATRLTQNRNRTATRYLTFNGRKQCLSMWAIETGLTADMIYERIKTGWSVKDSLTLSKFSRQTGSKKEVSTNQIDGLEGLDA